MMARIHRHMCSFTERRRVAVPATEAWAMMARPGYLEDSHPFCLRNTVRSWPGVGSWDTVHYYNGKALHREFVRWVDGAGYTVNVRKDDNTIVAVVEFAVTGERGGSACTMSTAVRLPTRGGVANLASMLLWKIKLESAARFYFSAVLKGFEYFLTTGNRVRREQFGEFRNFFD